MKVPSSPIITGLDQLLKILIHYVTSTCPQLNREVFLQSLHKRFICIFFQAYWIGPLVGGAIAAWLYDFVFAVNASVDKIRGFFQRNYDDSQFGPTGRIHMGDPDESAAELKGAQA